MQRHGGAGGHRHVWRATGVVALVITVGVGVLVATRPSSGVPPPVQPSAADRGAPPSLVKAASAIGFRPATEPGVGVIEGKPASAAQPPANAGLLPVGSRAPSFALETPEGKTVGLSSLRGRAVLLEFFATWCPHCQAEAPHLRRLFASLPRSRFAFLAVNADGEDAASVFAFHRYFGLQFPAVLDPSSQPGSFHDPGGAGRASTLYRVQRIPTFYVVGRNGQIAWRSDGEQPDALLRLELARAAARG